MNFNIIGAGKLGKCLAYALSQNRLAQLGGIYNSSIQSSRSAAADLGEGLAVSAIKALPQAEVYFICTPDDAIASIAEDLAKHMKITPGSFFIHCSGPQSSEVLSPLKEAGGLIASMHPLKSFDAFRKDKNIFYHITCALEGNEPVLNWLKKILDKLHAAHITIAAQDKALYHAAAVMASNYLVTLASIASDCFQSSGITESQAKMMSNSLMQSCLNNIKQSEKIHHALTGPISRGDCNTIEQHLNAIETTDIKQIYQQLGLETLKLCTLSEDQKNKIGFLLKTNNK